MLYQLLTGRLPFLGGTAEVIYAHLHATAQPPSQLRGDLPPALERLVLALLAKDPAHRPAHAASVRAALADQSVSRGPSLTRPLQLDEPPMAASRQARHQPADRLLQKRLFTLAGLVGVGLLLVAGLALAVQAFPDPGATNAGTAAAGTPTAPATTTNPAPTPTPTPTPTRTPSPPTSTTHAKAPAFGSVAWLRKLDATLATLAANGQVHPEVADKHRDKISDVLAANAEGDDTDAHNNQRELYREIAESYREGDLRLVGPLNRLIPPSTLTARGEQEGNHDGEHDEEDDDD